jgi:hypothetical protein
MQSQEDQPVQLKIAQTLASRELNIRNRRARGSEETQIHVPLSYRTMSFVSTPMHRLPIPIAAQTPVLMRAIATRR